MHIWLFVLFISAALLIVCITPLLLSIDEEKAKRLAFLNSLMMLSLMLVTTLAVWRWTLGVVGDAGIVLNLNYYYEVIGVGKSFSNSTPVILKRPNGSLRAVKFYGAIGQERLGTTCKVKNFGGDKYTLEPIK